MVAASDGKGHHCQPEGPARIVAAGGKNLASGTAPKAI